MADMEEPIPGDSFGGLAPLLITARPLFGRVIDYSTVVQQGVTNCPLPALLAAMAHAMPDRLRDLIEKRSLSRPRTSSFFEKDPKHSLTVNEVFKVRFQHNVVEVSPVLYLRQGKPGQVIPRFAMATDDSGWVSYIEKAYVVYRCKHKYSNLDFLGSSATPLTVERVVEDVARDFDWFRLNERELWRDPEPLSPDPPPGHEHEEEFKLRQRQITSFRRNRGVRRKLDEIFGDHATRATIVTTHNHTLAVVDYKRKTGEVTLYDAMRNARRSPMNLSRFLQSHDSVYQVRI